MNKLLRNLVLLLLCFAMTVGCFAGCKKTDTDAPVSSDTALVGDDTSSDIDDVSSNDTSSEEEIEDESDDSTWQEEEPQEELPSEEDDIYIGNAFVQNASTPIMDNWMGMGSVVYQMYTYMPYLSEKNEYTEAQAQLQFDRMQEIGVKTIRSDWNSYMAWDGSKFDYENTEYVKAFYKEGLEMKKRGIDIGITTGWSHHALVDDSSSIPSRELYVKGDWNATLTNWKNWMSDSILAFRAHGLTNLKYLYLFTEPGKAEWNDNGSDPLKDDAYRYDMYEKYVDCAKTLHATLKDLGVRNQYQVIGPNQSALAEYKDTSGDMMTYVFEHADECFDVYSAHAYPNASDPTDDVWYDAMQMTYKDYHVYNLREVCKSDKPFWIDEFGISVSGYRQHVEMPWKGTHIGVATAAYMEFGVQNAVLWALYSQQWPNSMNNEGEFSNGIHMTGWAFGTNLSTVPYTQYYGYTVLSKYLRDMDTVFRVEYDTTYSLYYGYATNDNGDTTFFAVNAYAGEDQGFEMEFEKSLGGKTFYRHVYDPLTTKPNSTMQVVPADRAYKIEDKLVDRLPAGAVAVYTTIK